MESKKDLLKKTSWQFILLFGVISMFGDITYEGGRSITAPYLALLGASAGTIGVISGLGEFIGYGFRLVTGYLAARTKSYWLFTFIGYGLLISIPLLASANNWPLAAFFVVLERFGKAVRSPAKDTMLSFATSNTGRGSGFAIHEFIDQIGGVVGPLIFSAVFLLHGSYYQGFTWMWIPAFLTMVFLMVARIKVPDPESLEVHTEEQNNEASSSRKLPSVFWWYMLFAFLSVLGFANFQLIAYHVKTNHVLTNPQIPLFYAIAMGVDALAALAIGKLYDKIGLKSLVWLPLLSIAIPFFSFSFSFSAVLFSVILWGIVMAIHETVMRAAIADMIARNNRAFAYGLFNTAYGLAWFVGSTSIGYLYEQQTRFIYWFVTIAECFAIMAFMLLFKNLKPTANNNPF